MKNFSALFFFFQMVSALAFSSPLSVVEYNYKWNKSTIKVCWSNDSKYADSKKIKEYLEDIDPIFLNESEQTDIQNLIQKEYTLEKVGIEFVGWKDCVDNEGFDIAVIGLKEDPESEYEDEAPNSQARIGLKSNKGGMAPPDEKGYVFLYKEIPPIKHIVTAAQNLKITSLHEFGHAAGLRHEHIRSEALQDINCRTFFDAEFFADENKERPKSAVMIGDYDPESIMNYCYGRFLRRNLKSDDEIKLSAGDTKALRCMYLAAQEPEGTCEQKNFEHTSEIIKALFPEP